MAGDPHILSWQLTDDEGKNRSHVQYLDNDATLAEIQAWCDEHINILEAVVGGKIASISVQFSLDITSPNTTSPVADHPNDNGALSGFSVSGTKYKHSIYLPGFRKSLITAGVIADTGAAAAWEANILSPTANVIATDKAGRALSGFLGFQRRDRK